MIDLIPSVFGLVGVVIGGLLSYTVQGRHQKNMEKRKDERDKHIAYNQFLLNDGTRPPVFFNHIINAYDDFDWAIYSEGPRKVLYKNLHLLEDEIKTNVLQMDMVAERVEAMGIEDDDIAELCDRYIKIRKAIKEDYKNDL